LYLQPVITKQEVTVVALVDLICIYVEAPVPQHVAKAEVVASHCRVMAQIECRYVSTVESSVDETSGFVLVEQNPLEALFCERFPTFKTLADICGHFTWVVPKLNDYPGYASCATWWRPRNSVLDKLSNMTRAQMVVLGNVGGIIK
jgi:hypothetical protein